MVHDRLQRGRGHGCCRRRRACRVGLAGRLRDRFRDRVDVLRCWWRWLSARLRHGRVDEAKERLRAVEVTVAITFFLLAGYITITGVRDLIAGEMPDTSPVGIAVLVASLIVDTAPGRSETPGGRRVGWGSALILADAAETRVCVWLSVSTLAGAAAVPADRPPARPCGRIRDRRLRHPRGHRGLTWRTRRNRRRR